MLKVGIIGIGGRMGHALYECGQGLCDVKVVCGVDKNTDNLPLGFNEEVVPKVTDLSKTPDLFIDFSRPECSNEVLAYAREHGVKMVLGTTGFSAEELSKIREYSRSIPIVFASNFSVGVNVLLDLIEKASRIMADADLEIIEAHHRYKVDAPSGTALSMGEAAARGRNVSLKDVMVAGRSGNTGERSYGTIGFSSIRGGDIVGEHKAMFCTEGERVELGHVASSRQTFAKGAFRAALWVNDKKPSLYSMKHVLGL